MSTKLRFVILTSAIAAALTLPLAATAAPASTSFAVVGYEYAFTQTVGSFAGTASGNAGGSAVWNATVRHDPLGSTPTYVNGGSFRLLTGSLDTVTGTFVHHGGTITTLSSGPNCTNQQYRVTGQLRDVTTSTTSGGSGAFAATLTHFRTRLLGHCIIYAARVAGTVSLAY